MDNYHLSKKDGNWRLKKEGASRASKVFEGSNKNEATRKSASTLRNRGSASSLKIHKENGRIQEERTYPRKADPRKSKG
ncbi:DUF2188 domain-containing protein [Gracilimonas sediminicola]|uniref:DUF2188 domain-containing protein n=1 Tax=Gracilimonas sediminicola TaxID=2952158 RepID=UPI0038D3CE8D